MEALPEYRMRPGTAISRINAREWLIYMDLVAKD
jgi:hypothetical protein